MKKREEKVRRKKERKGQQTCRGACTVLCMMARLSTYQTSVENVKQSLGRNHVGLRKDYNTIYLEKHNVTLGDVTWDS